MFMPNSPRPPRGITFNLWFRDGIRSSCVSSYANTQFRHMSSAGVGNSPPQLTRGAIFTSETCELLVIRKRRCGLRDTLVFLIFPAYALGKDKKSVETGRYACRGLVLLC